MTVMLSVTHCALAAAVLALGYVLRVLVFHPLAHVPGPKLAAFTGAWKVRHLSKSSYLAALDELHQRHGPLVRIGYDEVSIKDVEACKIIYTRNGPYLKLPSHYRPFNDPLNDLRDIGVLFSEARPDLHADRRKMLAPAFAKTYTDGFKDYVLAIYQTLVAKLAERDGSVVDMSDMFYRFAFDVSSDLVFDGPGFGMLQEGDKLGLIPALETQIGASSVLSVMPSLQLLWFTSGMQWLASKGPLAKVFDHFNGVSERIIKARRENPSDRADLLGKMLETEEKKSFQLSLDDVLLDVGGSIIVGSDSTSYTLTSLLHHVVSHPAVYRKLEKECDSIAGDEADRVFYKACLMETFRLSPATPWQQPRIVPKGGAALAGKYMAAGVAVAVSPYVQHRIADIFGEDVNVFRPERWFVVEGDKADEERVRRMHDALFHFGGGDHTCIGQHVAQLVINTCLPRLFTDFRLELVPGVPDTYKETSGLLPFVHDFKVRVTLRAGAGKR